MFLDLCNLLKLVRILTVPALEPAVLLSVRPLLKHKCSSYLQPALQQLQPGNDEKGKQALIHLRA